MGEKKKKSVYEMTRILVVYISGYIRE